MTTTIIMTTTDRKTRKTNLPQSLHKTYDNIDRSRKDAIKIFCVECVGGGASGFRHEIKNCTDYGCPLYTWRPYKNKDVEKEEDQVESEDNSESDISVKPDPIQVKKKKCCDNPNVIKHDDIRRECKNCGKSWKRKKKGI